MKQISKLFLGLTVIGSMNAHALDIIEVFSFTCVHCYNIEPQVEASARQAGIKYIPVPLYNQSNINEVAAINAYFAADSLGKGWSFRQSYFNAVFVQNYPAYAPQTLAYVLNMIGLSNPSFYQLASSSQIIAKVSNAVNLAIKYNVTGTPTFIVNGQFYEGEDALQQIFNNR